MIRVRIIGFGSMGSMLTESLLRSGRIGAKELIISTRTKSKLDAIQSRWDGIHIARDNQEVVCKAKYIFLCVKPLEMKDILNEISGSMKDDTNLISIAGTVPMDFIENLTHARVSKMIPSITSEVSDGIALVCHGSTVTAEETAFIEYLLNGISRVKRIEEKDFGMASELTSCMPGFIAAIFDEFVKAAMRKTDSLSKADVEGMILRTLHGTSRLFVEKGMSFEEMIRRVATKGGITEEGIKVFNAKLPEVFDEMFQVTLEKRNRVAEKVKSSFQD